MTDNEALAGRLIDKLIAVTRQAMPRPWEDYWQSVDYMVRRQLRRDIGLPTKGMPYRNPEQPTETTS